MSKYKHREFCPLEDPSKDLRVLQIRDNDRKQVECELVLNAEGQPYDTLSWCWGPRTQEQTQIRIFHANFPYEFSVPLNLGNALKELRRLRIFRIWIDLLCIDQDSSEEKNNQVPMMASIYGDASRVYVWLGEEAGNSETAMRFIRTRVLNLSDFDRLVKDKGTTTEWQAVSDLIKRPWFSRRWIVQEIAVAKEAKLLCGTSSIEWKDFADAISLFNEVETRTRSLSDVMQSDENLRHMPDFFGHVPAFSATKLVEVTNNLFRRLSNDEREAKFNLDYLVSTLTAFEATEPRDTVYALLAIARDTIPRTDKITPSVNSWPDFVKQKFTDQMLRRTVSKPYAVDYDLPLSDIYVEFVKWAIERSDKSRALDMLCRPWAPAPSQFEEPDDGRHWRIIYEAKVSSRKEPLFDPDHPKGPSREDKTVRDTLPSWIPTIVRAPFGMDGAGRKMNRKNADILVGMPLEHRYSAAGTRTYTSALRFEEGCTRHSERPELNNLHYHSLFVEGIVLDKVDDPKSASQQGNIPKDWLKMGRERSGNNLLSDEFLRALVADRGPSGGNAPRYYARLIKHANGQGVYGDALNTAKIVDYGDCKIVGEVLRRVQAVIWNRSMTRTQEQGRLALIPENARKGDLVCILYGCSVPVVLRQFKKSDKEVEYEAEERAKKQKAEERTRRDKAITSIARIWRSRQAARKARATATTSPGRKRKRHAVENGASNKRHTRASTFTPSTSTPPLNSTVQEHSDGNGAEDQGAQPTAPRETAKVLPEGDPATFYQLIGECYVDGMMNGEALSSGKRRVLFEIR